MMTKRKRCCMVLLSILPFLFSSCTKQTSDIILADVGPEKVTVTEFEHQLSKNSGGWEAAKKLSQAEKEKYLDLLVKFRLKILDAYRRGLDKDPEVLRDIQEYEPSLAASFFLDKVVVAPGLHLLYDRRKEEVRANHILFRFPPKPTPADTLAAWQKASDVLKRAMAGEDFAKLAEKFSDDYSTRRNGGDIYYFSSGFTVPGFEDACFHLQAGQIYPAPVRTPYGYHIIKLTDRKPSRGEVRASHMMVRFHEQPPAPEDTLKAYAKIKALEDSLRAGGDFAELAKAHSEDTGSAAAGGDLGFFERRRAVQPFDEAAFSLGVGQVSGIVRTQYGYHLIKLTAEKPMGSFDEMKSTLRDVYQKHRYTYDYENFIRAYKTAVGLRFDDEVVDTLVTDCDSTKTCADSLWDQGILGEIRKRPVFTFAADSVAVTLDSVMSVMRKDPEFSKTQLKADNIRKTLDKIAERSLIRYRTRNLESEYPEFKQTLKEYKEGVLLYRLEQQQVWNKVSVNDSLLHAYFEEHRNQYTMPDRVNFQEIYVSRDSNEVLGLLDSLKAGVEFGDLASRHTMRVKYRQTKGEWGFQTVGENDLAKKAWTLEVGQVSGIIRFQEGYSIIKVIGKEKSRPKTYEEALPDVSGQYHDYAANRLEEEWLGALRKEFKVTMWKENLGAAFVSPQQEKKEE
jgi:peptidyl-prolyl cis-trans isomerase SurA